MMRRVKMFCVGVVSIFSVTSMSGCIPIMVGAAALIARANGLSEKKFRDKLTQMTINNETTFGMGIAAAALGTQHPSGVWIPNHLLANVNKVHVATLPYETKRITQDIAGGIAETGCLPSYIDLYNEQYGELLRKYLSANCSGETRAKLARLIEWLTIGAGVPGCMHGGGSPDGAKLIIQALSNLETNMKHVQKLINLEENLVDEIKKK